jgi:hypothetical protein
MRPISEGCGKNASKGLDVTARIDEARPFMRD